MVRRVPILIPVLVLSFILAVILGASVVFHTDAFLGNVIVYDGSSFTPETLTVSLGETVIFKNKSGQPFWPASNLHPSHLQWSEFDPKEPIAAGESWSFTFTKAGNWGYHDHIAPTLGGVVRVRDENGDTVDPNDCTIASNKLRCWEKDITALLDKGDVEGAFDYMAQQEEEPYFLQNCHALVHLIGESAYTLFSSGEQFEISQKTTYCGYGFYHGFMETLLTTTGDLQEALDFCAYVNDALGQAKEDARDACYHGIGHGAVDGGDPRTWGDAYAVIQPALQLCDRITVNTLEEVQCGSGVFDGLVTAYSEQSFGFSEIPEDFYTLCAEVENPHYKEGCYRQMNPLAAYFGEGDIQKTFDLVKNISEPAYRGAAMSTVIATFARNRMDKADYDTIINACHTLEKDLRKSCITGFVTRLMGYGTPETGYLLGIDFCRSDLLQGEERTMCFATVPSASYTRKAACEAITPYTDISVIVGCHQFQ